VAAGPIRIHDPPQLCDHLFRGFAVGIPQSEIKNIVFSALPFHPGANLEHSPDPGGVFHLFRNSFANTHVSEAYQDSSGEIPTFMSRILET
jgi:hypothetical protein